MNVINKKIRVLFWVALALSVGFPLGILGIIFGAVKDITALLVIGIVFTVLGFYLMPILWVRYGEMRGDRSLLFIIENEKIHTVTGLSAQTGYSVADVRNRVTRLIKIHALVGYVFKNDMLDINQRGAGNNIYGKNKKCQNCGAPMLYDGVKFKCEYCGRTDNDDT